MRYRLFQSHVNVGYVDSAPGSRLCTMLMRHFIRCACNYKPLNPNTGLLPFPLGNVCSWHIGQYYLQLLRLARRAAELSVEMVAAGARFAPGRTGKVRGGPGVQKIGVGLAADPMADFRPGRTTGFADNVEDGASDIMSRLPAPGAQTMSSRYMTLNSKWEKVEGEVMDAKVEDRSGMRVGERGSQQGPMDL
jgi:hypothetical protein